MDDVAVSLPQQNKVAASLQRGRVVLGLLLTVDLAEGICKAARRDCWNAWLWRWCQAYRVYETHTLTQSGTLPIKTKTCECGTTCALHSSTCSLVAKREWRAIIIWCNDYVLLSVG